MPSSKNEMVILVQSCDAFSDVWMPFFSLFDKFWPDCHWRIFLISETKVFTHEKVTMINTNSINIWSDMLLYALENIESDQILYLLEDYFLNKKVSTIEINSLLQDVLSSDIECIRLYPCGSLPLIPVGSKVYGKIDSKEPYLVSTQASIWKINSLKALVIKGETGWDFERNASVRARKLAVHFYSIWPTTKQELLDEGDYPIRYLYLTSVTRGRWTMKTLRFCKKNGISLDLHLRKANSWLDEYYMEKAPLLARHIIDFINCRTKRYLSIDLRTFPHLIN